MQHDEQRNTAKRSTKAIVGGAMVAATALAATAAMAASTTVTDTDNVHLRVVKSHFDDGFVGDWHTHAGPVIIQVQRGFFKIYQGSCAPTVVGPGETYIEIPNVPVRGAANGEIEWTTTLIYETGQQPSTPAADPC